MPKILMTKAYMTVPYRNYKSPKAKPNYLKTKNKSDKLS